MVAPDAAINEPPVADGPPRIATVYPVGPIIPPVD
jgi:hypothetical protein